MSVTGKKGFGRRGNPPKPGRRFDLIEKPPARNVAGTAQRTVDALTAGRDKHRKFSLLKQEIADASSMEGRGLVISMLEDPNLFCTPMPIEDFLIHIRTWGASRVVEVCQSAGVAADTPTRDLTDKQRAALVKRLRKKG